MAWQSWVYTKSGVNVFISEHPSEAAGAAAVRGALSNGYFEIPGDNPSIRAWYPLAAADVHVAYMIDTLNPAPTTQKIVLDPVAGIDPFGVS